MNFFEAQARSRRNTGRLVLLFILGGVGVVLAVNSAIFFLLTLPDPERGARLLEQIGRPRLFGWTTLVTLGLILSGTFLRILSLGSGGRGVARMIGATPVDRAVEDPELRKLLNVVDEMAIASGIAPPEVFVLEEPSINAMAAGYEPSNAAIIVNRGTLESLGRDELQAVIAHEFSHIFNGDMRLNVRLISVIAGIMVLSTVGEIILRSGRGNRKGNGVFLVLGFALFIIGSIGALFARLIQAAVSRQREFLADASAVQYTRNPESLISCFRKMLVLPEGSRVSAAGAAEVGHLFFGAISARSLFSTHPPLEERIRAIQPRALQDRESLGTRAAPASASPPDSLLLPGVSGFPSVESQIGNPQPPHLAEAQRLLKALPPEIQTAMSDRLRAESLLFALVSQEGGSAGIPGPLLAEVSSLRQQLRRAGPQVRLPVLSVTLSTLRELDLHARLRVLSQLRAIVEADQRLDFFEIVALVLAERELLGQKVSALLGRRRDGNLPIGSAISAIQKVLWCLSSLGAPAEPAREARRRVYERACQLALGRELPEPPPPVGGGELARLHPALWSLQSLDFLAREKFLKACWESVRLDGQLSVEEWELLRAIHCVLDCPMPLRIAGATRPPG